MTPVRYALIPQAGGTCYVIGLIPLMRLLLYLHGYRRLSGLPGLCTPPLFVKYGPLIQVRQPGEGADDGPPVLLGGVCHWVTPEIQTAELRQLR